jgi:hypothetical protein
MDKKFFLPELPLTEAATPVRSCFTVVFLEWYWGQFPILGFEGGKPRTHGILPFAAIGKKIKHEEGEP